jgi:hypothetical protein
MVPAIIQVWASETAYARSASQCNVDLIVNRTPTVADLTVNVGGESYISGCGLWREIGVVPKGAYRVMVAVTTPAIALINDGKTPDLKPFGRGVAAAVGPALRAAHRPKRRGVSIKDAAFDVMAEAYQKASANGTLPANARQIMYAARPYILVTTGCEKLNDAYFTQTLLPTFIEENPNLTETWDVVYDARGHLIEPHTDHSLPLGTLQVRDYLRRRPRYDATDLISMADGLHPTAGVPVIDTGRFCSSRRKGSSRSCARR